jgi:polysaccharide biosynthesis transport protein
MSFARYIAAIRRRWWLPVSCVVLGAVATYVFSSSRQYSYRSTASILLLANDPGSTILERGLVNGDGDRYLQNQVDVVKSDVVLSLASAKLNLSTERLKAMVGSKQLGLKDLLGVSATAASAPEAQRIVAAVSESYVEFRRLDAVKGLETAAADLDPRLEAFSAALTKAADRVAKTTEGSSERKLAEADFTSNNDLYQNMFVQKQQFLNEVPLKKGSALITNTATLESSPVSPRPIRNALAVGLAGLLLGVGVTLLLAQLDSSIQDPADLERVGMSPVLADLPRDRQSDRQSSYLAAYEKPTGPFAEGIRTLRTAIQFYNCDRPLKTVVFTSCSNDEGRTLVASNLAVSFAELGLRTLFICGDLRNGASSMRLPTDSSGDGLSDALSMLRMSNGSDWSYGEFTPYLTPVESVGVVVMKPGSTFDHPERLLSSSAISSLVHAVRDHFEIIIIDAAPLGVVSDALEFGAVADGTVLVSGAGTTSAAVLAKVTSALGNTSVPVLGAVLTR